MIESMKEKTAVITGATSGIGQATARQGVKLALAGRNEKGGKELEKELISQGGEALFIKTDVSNSDSVKSFIQTVKKSFGSIHYALNNAGVEGNLGPLGDMEEKDFDEVISIKMYLRVILWVTWLTQKILLTQCFGFFHLCRRMSMAMLFLLMVVVLLEGSLDLRWAHLWI